MFGAIKIAQGLTENHGARLQSLMYKVTVKDVQFPAPKPRKGKPKSSGPITRKAFVIECQGFHTDEVDATSEEALMAVVKETIRSRKLFSYKTPFSVSPLAKPLTGTGACLLLDKLKDGKGRTLGLSCLIAWSEDDLKGEEKVKPAKDGPNIDLLDELGISPEDLGIKE
jgi:hypothetical protein